MAVTDPTFSTRKGLPESGEGGGGGGGTPPSGSVPLALRHLRTGFHFTFHLLFTAAKSLRAKKNGARGVWGARGGVCAAAWLCEQGCEELLGYLPSGSPVGEYLFVQCNMTVRLPLLDQCSAAGYRGRDRSIQPQSCAFAETVTPRSFFVFNLEVFRAYKQDFDIPIALD